MISENLDFVLGFRNIKDIPFDKYEKDFTFIVNEKRYNTPRIIADILSPNVRKLHSTDPTINEIRIDIKSELKGQTLKEDYFEEFLNLVLFKKTTIDLEKQKLFSKYFYILGNFDECLNIYSNHQSIILSIDNIIQHLQAICSMIPFIDMIDIKNAFIVEMVDFCSSHFEEIDKEKLKGLQISIIEEIIKNDKLRLSDEDSLLNFILSINDNVQTKSNLFEYVLIKNLSEEGLRKFVDHFDIEFFNGSIWHNICDCLLFHGKKDHENTKRYIGNIFKKFERKEGSEFEGIMRYLTNKTGGNIHDNGTIEITSNSINGNSQIPRNCVDYDNNNNYCSDAKNDSFVCFDFKDRSIQVSSYSIQSRDDGDAGYTHLKNWAIDVKNENEDWIEIDRRENDASLNGRNNKSTFTVNKQCGSFYRFVRLRQTGPSWFTSNTKFGFKFIEFHGKLIENNK